MKILSFLACMAIALTISGCGGGGSSIPPVSAQPRVAPAVPKIEFIADYKIPYPYHPDDSIMVRPADNRLTLGTSDIAKVELLVFGQDLQVLTQSNFGPKVPPQLRYVFHFPPATEADSYPCGTGQYLSELRVTDVNGFVLSKTFELCRGVPQEIYAASAE